MSSKWDFERASLLLEDADKLAAQARELLQPYYDQRGWKGTTDQLTVICAGGIVPAKDELQSRAEDRRKSLEETSAEIDGALHKSRSR